MDEFMAQLLIRRLLVIESAQAAGLLVTAPVGNGGGDVLLVVSREARGDGTFACVRVRVCLPGPENPDQERLVSPPEDGEWLALVASDDYEDVYLVPGAEALARENWRSSGLKATPQCWTSLFQLAPDTIPS